MSPLTPSCPACALIPSPVTTSLTLLNTRRTLVISGTSTDLAAGSTVTVTINGKSYSASVLADGTWQAAVPAADVSRWADGSLIISASAQDTSGNPVNIGTVVDVDLAPVAISINSVTDDNVLNAAEKGRGSGAVRLLLER